MYLHLDPARDDLPQRQAAASLLRDELVASLREQFGADDAADKQLKAAFRSMSKSAVLIGYGLRLPARPLTAASSALGAIRRCVSSGRLTASPRCVNGSVAMKMMNSTSSTSMSGVTFMSDERGPYRRRTTYSPSSCSS